MTADLLKLRSLPTPRWTAIGALAALALTIAITIFTGVGTDDIATGLGADLPSAVAAIIIGVWIVGVEYGQGTMRRTLTAEPRRGRVLAAKLATALAAAAALTVVIYTIAAAAFPLIASAHAEDLPVADVARMGLAALIGNLAAAAFGVGVGFLTRSMAGGITIALVFSFVVDSALSAIPKVGAYTFQSATLDIWEAITGADGDPNVLRAAAVLLAWTAAFVAAGALRFTRADA